MVIYMYFQAGAPTAERSEVPSAGRAGRHSADAGDAGLSNRSCTIHCCDRLAAWIWYLALQFFILNT